MAEQTLREAIHIWEFLRQDLGNNDANKVSIFEGQARTYLWLQAVLIAEHQPNAALEIAERGRGRAFVELLARQLATSGQPSAKSGEIAISPPGIKQIQQAAKAQNSAFVEYSIIYNNFKIQAKQESHESELYIWVIQPIGQITFRKVDLKPLWQQQNTMLAELVENSRKGIGVLDRGDRATLTAVLTPNICINCTSNNLVIYINCTIF